MLRLGTAFTLVFLSCSLAVLGFSNDARRMLSPKQTTSAAAGEWKIVPSPNTTNQPLTAVGCASAADCWAIGHSTSTNNAMQPLIEHWDGNAWSIVTSPHVSDYDALLTGVFCSFTANCWASGYYFDSDLQKYSTLIEHWDGNAWSRIATPNPGTRGNKLFALTCTSAADCWAVGSLQNTGSSRDQTLTLHWDGATWSAVTSPNTSTTQSNLLISIACVSTSSCFAVGYYGSTNQTLIEQWNGATWAIVASPNTSSSLANLLQDVTCNSATDCVAVGYARVTASSYQTLIEHWDGTTWTITSSPNNPAAVSSFLFGVSCNSATQCWAVGYSLVSGNQRMLIAHWDGSAWSLSASPPDNFLTLYAVTCTSTTDCWAVGAKPHGTLITKWDGANWAAFPSPNATGGGFSNTLYDVACVTGNDCWSIGIGDGVALIQHWDGSSWSLASAADADLPYFHYLYGVTCTSTSNCWAVGDYSDASGKYHTLTLFWDGNSWTHIASPGGAAANNYLSRVMCNSASDCWTVGASGTKTLIERWNGTAWTVVTSANVAGASSNYLADVRCASANDCWTVGYFENASLTEQTLVEHWDGVAWTRITSPNQDGDNILNALECNSTSDCWAVGYSLLDGDSRALIEHWNGLAWTLVTSPVDAGGDLEGIDCISASNCWTVGSQIVDLDDETLIEHWDGMQWSAVSSPNFDEAHTSELFGVSCSSAARCVAVGSHDVDDFSGASPNPIPQTLTEHFTGLLQLTSAVRDSSRHFFLTGKTLPNVALNLQASPDLTSPFLTIGSTMSDANGVFQFDDADAANLSKRFYRVTAP